MHRLSYEKYFYLHANLVHLLVNRTSVHVNEFALRLALEQRRNGLLGKA